MEPLTPLPRYRCPWRAGDSPAPAPAEWEAAPVGALGRWSGEPEDDGEDGAIDSPGSEFRLLADARAIHLRGRLVGSPPHLDPTRPGGEKSHGLWDFDVLELFLSPSPSGLPYGEVEGSPLGQFLDYWIEQPRALVDREWRSAVSVRGRVEPAGFVVELSVPWASFGVVAAPGVRLRMNVCAALGPPARRRHLAWSPTGTARPDFHVPARFGWLELQDGGAALRR